MTAKKSGPPVEDVTATLKEINKWQSLVGTRLTDLTNRVNGLYNTSYTMAQILQTVSGFDARLEKVEKLHTSTPPVDHRPKTKYVWVNTWWEGGKWYITEHDSYDGAKRLTEPPYALEHSGRKYINVATKAAVPVYWDGS